MFGQAMAFHLSLCKLLPLLMSLRSFKAHEILIVQGTRRTNSPRGSVSSSLLVPSQELSLVSSHSESTTSNPRSLNTRSSSSSKDSHLSSSPSSSSSSFPPVPTPRSSSRKRSESSPALVSTRTLATRSKSTRELIGNLFDTLSLTGGHGSSPFPTLL